MKMNKTDFSITDLDGLTLKQVQKTDVKELLLLINELADYEKLTDSCIATQELLSKALFEEHSAQALLLYYHNVSVGFCVYFYNFSTFLSRKGLYLEDIYIRPEYRGLGIGKTVLKYLASQAVQEGCGRMEWACLDWNVNSIGFYKGLGAKPLQDWTIYRLSGTALSDFAHTKNENKLKTE